MEPLAPLTAERYAPQSRREGVMAAKSEDPLARVRDRFAGEPVPVLRDAHWSGVRDLVLDLGPLTPDSVQAGALKALWYAREVQGRARQVAKRRLDGIFRQQLVLADFFISAEESPRAAMDKLGDAGQLSPQLQAKVQRQRADLQRMFIEDASRLERMAWGLGVTANAKDVVAVAYVEMTKRLDDGWPFSRSFASEFYDRIRRGAERERETWKELTKHGEVAGSFEDEIDIDEPGAADGAEAHDFGHEIDLRALAPRVRAEAVEVLHSPGRHQTEKVWDFFDILIGELCHRLESEVDRDATIEILIDCVNRQVRGALHPFMWETFERIGVKDRSTTRNTAHGENQTMGRAAKQVARVVRIVFGLENKDDEA
ncbi:MAG: hypothetical protein JWM72_1933 [Actinomycetia bacterium]|nr:hypothetical protein [Actinomycetes bacterium]